MKKPLQRLTGRAARRLRGLKRRLAGLQRAARRTAVVGCVAASTLGLSSAAFGQMGQAPMAASGGFVNRAAQGLRGINLNGAGRLYYGINAADRGLGYRGSYMTLGGYFPTVEDDLGGLWAADVRSHLSNYGGFFSNVGAVRKQLLGGGSLLGVGVYWDYDGDQNQYEDQLIGTIDPVLFPGGFSYNQVGISGEYLTDWGNIRSNGYIPVGSTGQGTGRFVSTNILCMQGINAALGGADLEVGAYVPGLADWAGMINVGGYTYGNTLYQLDTGANLVPFFGGVFTRIDLTFAQNWDFSLQYNNDSYFDSTGFARLTYRLGGSRRRNVPDQMEQPMMRNEHIVRAHQNAEVAINPINNQPWRVIHVNNTATAPGTGSISNPLTSLDGANGAETVANAQYDIIFVHQTGTAYSNAGGSPLFTFANSNQYLIGEGSAQTIPTLNCGTVTVSATIDPSLYPTLSPRPNDTAIAIPAGVGSETITGFVINASGTGISSQSDTGRTNTLTDLTINQGLTGIDLSGDRDYLISNVTLQNQTGSGLTNNSSGTIELTNATFSGIAGTALASNAGAMNASRITIRDTDGDAVIAGGTAQLEISDATIDSSLASGITNSGSGSITANDVQITATTQSSVRTSGGSTGTITLTQSTIDGSLASGGRSATGVLMQGDGDVTLNQTTLTETQTGVDVTGNGKFVMNAGSITNVSNDGISLRPTAPVGVDSGSAELTGVTMSNFGGNGIFTQGSGAAGLGGSVSFLNSTLSNVTDVGITGTNIGTPGTGSQILVDGSTISNTTIAGIRVNDSNLRVVNTGITNAGNAGIDSIDASTVLVDNTTIGGTETEIGIQATAANGLTFAGGTATKRFNSLTATNNTIAAETTGIAIEGAITTNPTLTPQPILSQGVVNARIIGNTLDAATPISLLTVNGVVGTSTDTGETFPDVVGGFAPAAFPPGRPQGIQIAASTRTSLEASNGGAEVSESPAPPEFIPGLGFENITTSVYYNPALRPQTPP